MSGGCADQLSKVSAVLFEPSVDNVSCMLIAVKNPPDDMVWKFRMAYHLEYHPRIFTIVQNYEVHCQYSSVAKKEIGSRVGQIQTTVMRICDRCKQKGTTDRRGRSHPPQCTSSREGRQIVRMAVTDRSVTSRTITQHIESVTHHSVSARTIRSRFSRVVFPQDVDC
ncbi:HTH_Tnp_Tc3_2 domain-containing protein [Trichonephila clavipes]|nr:HTH_Tnp_Tc3_2 domain-containing protein [Trichonephila clavipes]